MLQPRKTRKKLAADSIGEGGYPLILIELDDASGTTKTYEMAVMDINDSGMKVSCDLQLSVGQTIALSGNQMAWDLPDQGVVMWTFKANEEFQAGIKFLQKL